jgi:hypothetical protein
MHGTVCKSIYVHSDGYFSYLGQVLNRYYDSSKANQLVAQGDCSMVGKEIGEKINFNDRLSYDENNFADQCRFYGRDRGETGIEWQVDHSFEEFLARVDNCTGEYYYIMENGQWYCGSMRGTFERRLVLLSEVLESEAVEA